LLRLALSALLLPVAAGCGSAATPASPSTTVNSGCIAFSITFSTAGRSLKTQSSCDDGFSPIYTVTLHPGQTMTARRSTRAARYVPGWLPDSDDPSVLAASYPHSDHSLARYTALVPGQAHLLLTSGCAGLGTGGTCVVLRVKVIAGHG
jgi:hypothetical protein